MSNDELQKAIDDITSGEAAMDADGAAGASSSTSSSSVSSADDNILGVPPAPDTSSDMPAGATDSLNPATEAAPSVDDGPIGPDPLDGFDPSTVTLNTTASTDPASTGDSAPETASEPKMSVDLSVPAPAVDAPAVSTTPAEISAPETPTEPLAPAALSGAMAVEAAAAPVDTNDVEMAALKEIYPLLPKMNINPRQKFDICMKVMERTGEKAAAAVALESAKAITDEAEKGECLLKLIETFKG